MVSPLHGIVDTRDRLSIKAARDVNLIGAIVANQGKGGTTSITAKNDINLGTVTEAYLWRTASPEFQQSSRCDL